MSSCVWSKDAGIMPEAAYPAGRIVSVIRFNSTGRSGDGQANVCASQYGREANIATRVTPRSCPEWVRNLGLNPDESRARSARWRLRLARSGYELQLSKVAWRCINRILTTACVTAKIRHRVDLNESVDYDPRLANAEDYAGSARPLSSARIRTCSSSRMARTASSLTVRMTEGTDKGSSGFCNRAEPHDVAQSC